MKTYTASNRLPPVGLVELWIGSIVLGVALGVLAYIISNFIYLIIAFSLIIGWAVMIVFYKMLQFTKVKHSLIAASAGLLTGLLVAITFYVTPFLEFRHNYLVETQNQYHVNEKTASQSFENILASNTGSSGFLGFMKLVASKGVQFSNTLFLNSMPITEFGFTLKSFWAWLYWLLELLLFSIPPAWIGLEVGKRDFNESANDWYEELPNQIGSVPLDRKDELLAAMQSKDLKGLAQLVKPEDELSHPVLEIYKRISKNKKGDILLSIKQTNRGKHSKIKRNTISQWEVSQEEYTFFKEELDRQIDKLSLLKTESLD